MRIVLKAQSAAETWLSFQYDRSVQEKLGLVLPGRNVDHRIGGFV
jgi:hypothetical protein